MEKQKNWQFYLIIAVLVLTLYNIFPTIFYYTKPLNAPINTERAHDIAIDMVDRVNRLEDDATAWISSFSRLLNLHPESIQLSQEDPGIIEVTFANAKEASSFKRFLPQAGNRIAFIPSQLSLAPMSADPQGTKVLVARQINVQIQPDEVDSLFQLVPKYDDRGEITQAYRQQENDRIADLALGFGGPSNSGIQLAALASGAPGSQYDEIVLSIAQQIVEVSNALGKKSPITQRYFASVAMSEVESETLIQAFQVRAEALKGSLASQREGLLKEQQQKTEANGLVSSDIEIKISQLQKQQRVLETALTIVQQNLSQFKAAKMPLKYSEVLALLDKSAAAKDKVQILDLKGRNPYVQALEIDWGVGQIRFNFYPDVQAILSGEEKNETSAYMKDRLNQLVIQEIARVSQKSDETIAPAEGTYAVDLDTLNNTQSVLSLKLSFLAQKYAEQLTQQLRTTWHPEQVDLASENYPILTYAEYKKLPADQNRLGLVIYAPAIENTQPLSGFRSGSIYIIARNLNTIIQKYQQLDDSPERQSLANSVNQLSSLLQQKGFIGYPGASFGIDPAFRQDFIFELNDYYSNFIAATRENFVVKGSKRYGLLDFSDVEQRILTQNRIDDRIQEDLLKWKEEYNAAQVDSSSPSRYLIPAPTQNAFWQNLKLSAVKYFRGDDRKIIKWGLDLSGGKTVRIGLRDHSNRPVTDPASLQQVVNELYTRVNSMGVSERTIRIENHNIILDFPGSQNLSAAELVKASAMNFHIVNEKFRANPQSSLSKQINEFLQDVWNEAVVTNRKDLQSINQIAWEHLGGNSTLPSEAAPMSVAARELFTNGLRLANPQTYIASQEFNDTISKVAIMRGDDLSQWQGQSHPLMFVFANYALEGASLTNIQPSYDPSKGYTLGFGIKGSYEGGRGGNPRDDFYAWTSQFAPDKIMGTPKEAESGGSGWRMAVILNDQVISAPALSAALRDGGVIQGRFTQREVNQLSADLQAGSLSFTPQILSEENVSPELGKEERVQGITASLVALMLVVIAMIGYYHFAGIVASCAVLMNILIMWGVLQNLGAALTLPGIAGIVLTIGMAVDANVLVFERIREEFQISGRIASAIQAGYRKAFSAIFDSNLTTIIAALILLQFDSGPIKSFAVTLIIGIASSMFTALFMTRYFFAGWVQNPKNTTLRMSQFIGRTKFDFLSKAKPVIIASVILMLLGSYVFVSQRKTLFGMDFTGGYSLNVEFEDNPSISSYRLAALNGLQEAGATANDIQIRELNTPNRLRIHLGTSMEEKGHPFYQMPERTDATTLVYSYQSNPRITWVVQALGKEELQIVPSQLKDLESHWTVISGQLSDTMRNNAIIALTVALFCILLYITFRFEFKYAVAAVVALIHDVIITMGLLAIFHALGFQVQIDLQVIGAIMTIIGYSLNDTIIVFDRIREDLHILRKLPYSEIINHALNVTLSRTLMTSGTTLLVLIALVLLGGQSIFAFSLVMTFGVLVGTASSLFIASPMLLYLHNREVRAQGKEQLKIRG